MAIERHSAAKILTRQRKVPLAMRASGAIDVFRPGCRSYFKLLSSGENVRSHRGAQESFLSSERTTLEVLPTI